MSAARAGATRACPHCKATILESAAVCPACRHHLRFDAAPAAALDTALQVEGQLTARAPGEAMEYTVVVTIRNERGEEVARHVVGVGAIEGAQARTVTMAVQTRAVPARRR